RGAIIEPRLEGSHLGCGARECIRGLARPAQAAAVVDHVLGYGELIAIEVAGAPFSEGNGVGRIVGHVTDADRTAGPPYVGRPAGLLEDPVGGEGIPVGPCERRPDRGEIIVSLVRP